VSFINFSIVSLERVKIIRIISAIILKFTFPIKIIIKDQKTWFLTFFEVNMSHFFYRSRRHWSQVLSFSLNYAYFTKIYIKRPFLIK